MTTASLATPAWIMAGRLRNVPGVLAAGDGRLAFVTEDGPVFAVPIAEVTDVRWPWHWFGGGCRLTAAGEPYKITLVRPNGAPDVSPSLLDAGASLLAVVTEAAVPAHSLQSVFDIRSGRAAGAAWKDALPA
ncbi:hypothetical protein [Pseudonocardia nigra]|uniref:hypothetical protein n=1 Tax=Pseudonocardia nigra TaxID=1921578 RepID=UPI001C5E846A|nr:hypothetical protein [Pseudonocardia nigra]